MNHTIVDSAATEQVAVHLAPKRVACEPERPPAGTFWGNKNYKVDGYSIGLLTHHRRGFSYIANPIGWFPEYEAAVSAARQMERGSESA